MRSATSFCCIIHPQTPIMSSGFLAFKFLSAPRLPKTFNSAFSLTAQVLYIIMSADSLTVVSSYPMAQSMPEIISESLLFCWHPYVSTNADFRVGFILKPSSFNMRISAITAFCSLTNSVGSTTFFLLFISYSPFSLSIL